LRFGLGNEAPEFGVIPLACQLLSQELDDLGVNFLGPLLLRPVTAAGEQGATRGGAVLAPVVEHRCEVQQPAAVATVEDPVAVRDILAAQRLAQPLRPGPPGGASAMAS
jgi:hypothetical protein